MGKRKLAHPYWRPNYRIASTLPDIKVIRTGFVVNSIAIGSAVIVLFILLQKEYNARSLRGTVSTLESQIADSTPLDKKNLALNERFRSAGKHVEEVHTFYDSPFDIAKLVVDLSNSVPEGLVYKQMSLDESLVTVNKKSMLAFRISISGSVNELTVLDNYKKFLLSSDFLNPEGFVVDINETVRAPDPVTRIFPYSLSIVMKPVDPKKGAK